jgi:uncharacterized protein
MRQIFLLILLFIVGQWLVKALRRAESSRTARTTGTGASGQAGAASGAHTRSGSGNGPAGKKPAQLPEPMIRCAECGVHAPASESVLVEGQPFCSHDHAKRHAARPTGRDAR